MLPICVLILIFGYSFHLVESILQGISVGASQHQNLENKCETGQNKANSLASFADNAKEAGEAIKLLMHLLSFFEHLNAFIRSFMNVIFRLKTSK